MIIKLIYLNKIILLMKYQEIVIKIKIHINIKINNYKIININKKKMRKNTTKIIQNLVLDNLIKI